MLRTVSGVTKVTPTSGTYKKSGVEGTGEYLKSVQLDKEEEVCHRGEPKG